MQKKKIRGGGGGSGPVGDGMGVSKGGGWSRGGGWLVARFGVGGDVGYGENISTNVAPCVTVLRYCVNLFFSFFAVTTLSDRSTNFYLILTNNYFF